MSKSAHRLGDPNSAGAAIVEIIQPDVYINGILASIDGCPVAGHGPGEHAGPVTADGSPTVFIHNIPANRDGDSDSCGHPRAGGSSDVFIGP